MGDNYFELELGRPRRGRKSALTRLAVCAKYAKWLKANEALEKRQNVHAERLRKIQAACGHPEEQKGGCGGGTCSYICLDCGRVRLGYDPEDR